VSEISQIIGQIFAVDRGAMSQLMHPFWVNSEIQDCEIWPQATMEQCKAYFDISNRLGVIHECGISIDLRLSYGIDDLPSVKLAVVAIFFNTNPR